MPPQKIGNVSACRVAAATSSAALQSRPRGLQRHTQPIPAATTTKLDGSHRSATGASGSGGREEANMSETITVTPKSATTLASPKLMKPAQKPVAGFSGVPSVAYGCGEWQRLRYGVCDLTVCRAPSRPVQRQPQAVHSAIHPVIADDLREVGFAVTYPPIQRVSPRAYILMLTMSVYTFC